MRTMKDSERILLVAKIFLDLKGASTAKEISMYIEKCPVKIQKQITSNVISSLVKGHKDFGKIEGKPNKYYVIK